MSWWALDILDEEGRREALAAWLVARTGLAVEEKPDGTLVSFTPDHLGADRLLAQLAAEFGPVLSTGQREIEEIDWANSWKEGLGPRSFGRLTIVPSWVTHDPAPGETVVVLDPESAFGSGEHGSTRAALRLLERYVEPGDFVLDLGSGSGILSIASVGLGAARAVGIEQDEEANEVARRNAERNGVADRVSFFDGDGGQLAPLFAPADRVLSNILRVVNIAMLPEIHRALRPGGTAIFSGMENSEAAEFRGPLLSAGFRVLTELADADWWAVAAEPV